VIILAEDYDQWIKVGLNLCHKYHTEEVFFVWGNLSKTKDKYGIYER
jgi:hypothetical protein